MAEYKIMEVGGKEPSLYIYATIMTVLVDGLEQIRQRNGTPKQEEDDEQFEKDIVNAAICVTEMFGLDVEKAIGSFPSIGTLLPIPKTEH